MTHDPNVLNALYFSLDGRFFNYVLTVVFFGTLFVSVVCVFCPFEKTLWSSAVLFVVDKSCWGVIISYLYYDT
jgi:hypothetical protein